MRSLIKRHWPLLTAMLVLWVVVGFTYVLVLALNQGRLAYVLDDTYTHMAIARNLVQHGVWGVTSYAFSSSSSSLSWTLLLSLVYFLFGVNEAAPLILNLLFASLLLFTVYAILKKCQLRSVSNLAVLGSIILLGCLPSLVFCGLEHILHAAVAIAFVYLSASILSGESCQKKGGSSGQELLLLFLSPLLVMTRYEGLFLVFVVCVLFVLRRKLSYSLLLSGLGALPLVVYGLISLSYGSYLLPNSVILKGKMPALSSLLSTIKFFAYSGYYELLLSPHILFFVLVTLVLFVVGYNKQEGLWKEHNVITVIFVATTLLHMQFGKVMVVQYMRYEAYLMTLGIFAIAVSLHEFLSRRPWFRVEKSLIPKYLAIGLLVLLVILPLGNILVKRGLASLIKTPRAAANIYQQQYQMGLFLREFYQGAGVAAHDIGAINYLADIRCLDLWGLGSIEVTRYKSEGHYDTEKIVDLANSTDTRIAIVYDDWFLPGGRVWDGTKRGKMPGPELSGVPSGWIKVGQWKIRNNVACGRNTISFYAVSSEEADNLMKNLSAFADRLPKSVVQTGLYCDRFTSQNEKQANF